LRISGWSCRTANRRSSRPEEDVGGGVEVRGQGEVLVDGLDPQPRRLQRVGHRDLVAVHQDLAVVRLQRPGQALDQVDFPAPLSPTRA
jgi:hypothetical protein